MSKTIINYIKNIIFLITVLFTVWLFWNITYANNQWITPTPQKKVLFDIKFWKVFELFINNIDSTKDWKKKDLQACNYLKNNSIKKGSLEWFWNVLYFIIVNIIITGWFIWFIFYKVMDIYKDIRSEKVKQNWEIIEVQKDTGNILINTIVTHWKGILSIIIFYMVVNYLINMLTLSCH